MSKAKVVPQYIAGLSAAFGAFCMGSSIGWSSPVEISIYDGVYGFDVNAQQFGWLSSFLTLGAAFVCIPMGFLIDWIGRKPTMLLLIPPYMIGWALMIFANNVTMLYFGRFILGVCGGAFCVTAPMYTTEIAQLEHRGILGSFFQLLIVSGVLYGYIVGAWLELQTLNILCSILPIIFAIFFFFMPESPVYLVQKQRTESAKQALAWLRGKDYDTSAELAEIEASVQQSDNKINLREALTRRITLKGLSISIALMIFQQWTGINAILFYSTSIFEEAGTGISASLSTILVGAVMVVTTLAAVTIIEKAGRRILLSISAFFMAVTTAMMGVYILLKANDEESVATLGWLPVSSICLFIIFFSVGFGPLPWLVMAELFSEDIKSVGGSIAGTSNWLMAFMVTKLFPIFKETFGQAATFWIFTVVAVMAFLYCLLIVPETRGKTLLEIQAMLAGKSIEPKASKNAERNANN